MFSSNLIICGEDGIYARRSTQDEWQKVVSTEGPVEVLTTPDAAFAVDTTGDIWYSTEGFFWNRIGNSGDLIINQITKHRSQLFIASNKGAYSDYGSFYSGSVSLSLIDMFNDLEESAEVCVNSIVSSSNEAVFGLSDGRYITLSSIFSINENSLLDTIHKVLVVNSDLWLFGFDTFKVQKEGIVRRLASGTSVL